MVRVCALSLMVLSLVSCRRSVPEVDLSAAEPRVVLLSESHEPAEIRAAIIKAMQSRGWAAEEESANEIGARLNHKGSMVRVSMHYTADQVSIKAVQVEGRGYEKWVSNLEASIRSALKKQPVVVVEVPAPVEPPAPVVALTPPPTLVVFESKQAPEKVKMVLQRALTQHSWVIEQEVAGGDLIARLSNRRGQVRIRISADSSQATITYVDSKDVDIDAQGRSPEYEKWMRNLVDSVRSATR